MNPIRRFLRSHRLGAGLALWLVAEIVLRVFHVPYRIAWIPEWPAYDEIATNVVLGLKGPYRLPDGTAMSGHAGFFPTRANRLGGSGLPTGEGPRVLCLGGSTTMGAFVNDEETYPAQLESRLNAARRDGPSFEVINGGWSGTTSYYGAKTLADYVERFRPAVVVIGWGGLNDSLWVHFRETRLRLLSPVPRLLRSSAIYRLGECGLFRLWLYPEPVQRVSEDEYRGHLRTMHDVLRRRGVAAVFLTESLDPARNWSHVPVSQTHVAEKARIMAEEGNALSIPVVDVIPLVDRSVGGYLEDGIHWSLAGNGRIADAVAESIRIAKIENTLDVPGRHSSLENDRQRTFRGGESLSPQRRKHRDPWRAQRAANDGRSLPRVAESSILGAVATIQTYSMQ